MILTMNYYTSDPFVAFLVFMVMFLCFAFVVSTFTRETCKNSLDFYQNKDNQ